MEEDSYKGEYDSEKFPRNLRSLSNHQEIK